MIHIASGYSCIAEILGVPEYQPVGEVIGAHIHGKSNRDVEVLQVSNQPIKKMPRELESFFPKLIGIFFNHCNLTKITKEDLKPYKYLQYFSVRSNSLKTLDGNLFQHSPDLKFISFGYNPISKVGKNLLNNLHHLEKVSFIKTKCIDKAATQDSKQVEELKKELLEKCSNNK